MMKGTFISYSRANEAFVDRLVEVLEEQGIDVWRDLNDILPSAEWWEEILTGLNEAHTFVFVISQTSLTSPVCQLELAQAIDSGKRLIPIVYEKTDPAQAIGKLITQPLDQNIREFYGDRKISNVAEDNWQAIARHNWLFFDDRSNFDIHVQKLVQTIKTDIDYTRFHARLLVRALNWAQHKEQPDYLLKDAELEEAETWLDSSKTKEQKPVALQLRYITASRKYHRHRRRRTVSLMSALTSAGLLIGGAIAFWLLLQPPENPTLICSTLNIAVATFGEQLDVDDDFITTEGSRLLTDYVVLGLLAEDTLQDPRLPDEPCVKAGQLLPIDDKITDDDPRLAQITALAEDMNADLVIDGYIDSTRSPETVSFVPRLYINPRLFGVNEISGAQLFGEPIELGDFESSRSTLDNAFFPRIEALRFFLGGLADFKARRMAPAVANFKKAREVEDAWQKKEEQQVLNLWIGTTFERSYLYEYDTALDCPLTINDDYGNPLLNCAAAAYREILDTNPDYARAYLGMGNIHLDLATLYPITICSSYVPDATDAYQQALDAGFKSELLVELKGKYLLGLALRLAASNACQDYISDINLLNKAQQHFNQVLDLYHGSEDIRNTPEADQLRTLAEFELGIVYRLWGDYKLALDQFFLVESLAEPEANEREKPWHDQRWKARYQSAFVYYLMAQASNDPDDWEQQLLQTEPVIQRYLDHRYSDSEVVSGMYYLAGLAEEALGNTQRAGCYFHESVNIGDSDSTFYVEAQGALRRYPNSQCE